MKWEIVMGLEVHAELSTATKIFCGCSTEFGGEPNTRVCPVCSGLPGTLPVLNKKVVEYALRLGLSLNCDITRKCLFDRKNYFYPDLPKAYQVSQLYAPICRNGHLDIEANGTVKSIGIHQIHMEEDAGKLIHDASGSTLMDYNRCGVPLLEIVSEPDFRTSEEVIAYLEKLRETLLYLNICDCKMQEGSLRADVNLSVRPADNNGEFGTRTEMKNLNSFKAIARAIDFESKRQIEVIEGGGFITQETRRWDDDRGISYGMRSKENAHDYRYFPEPDLLPVYIDDERLTDVKAKLPELAEQKRKRYIDDFTISEKQADIITRNKNISDLFEQVCEHSSDNKYRKEAAGLFTGEIMYLLNNSDIEPEDLTLDTDKLSYLITLVLDGKINRDSYKEVVDEVFKNNIEPESYIKEKGLLIVEDNDAVTAAVKAVIADNPGPVADYRSGKKQAFGFLMGIVMKSMKGNPATVKSILEKELES